MFVLFTKHFQQQNLCPHKNIKNKEDIPIWTLSPIWSSDIFTDFPFSNLTLAAEGKQYFNLERDSKNWENCCDGEIVVVVVVVVLLVVVLFVVANCPGLPVGNISTNRQ